MALELVAGAAVSASVEFLLGKISSYLTEKKDSDFDMLLHELKMTFLCLKAVLTDAEQKQVRNPQVKEWLDELEDAVDEARDLFDDIEYDALKLTVKAESKAGKVKAVSKTGKVKAGLKAGKSKVRDFFHTIFYLTDGKRKTEMVRIRKKLNNFAEKSKVLGLENGGVRENPSQRLPSTSLMERSELYGRNADKAAIMENLMSDAARQEICVIPIVGMGGVGKTTLAQAIFNDEKVEKHFNLRAWVCVSDEFDACKVTGTILKKVDPEASNDTDLNSLQVKLKERLTGQRFLIVLDDVWNERYNDWKDLKKPFDHGAQGSGIIVTSRSDKVASIMRTLPSHHLKQLEDEECWQIFAKHASGGNSEYFTQNSNLERIGREIVKKCKGLPLAATTLGGLLRSTSDVGEWNRIANSEFWELPNEQSNILPALRLSYHYLPSHLKRCFVYCSMFPKDYEFEKEKLVSLWMAENLLEDRSKNNMEMEEVGDEYFNDLVSRSFFQHSSTDESLFVMHDVMVDLAKFVSRKMYFHAEEGKSNEIELIKQAHHIVYDGRCNKSHERFKSISEATCLRTLLPLFSSSSVEVPLHDLLKLRHLRYLSLYGYGQVNELPESIGDLRYIRYLDLSRTSIKVLPESLCRLYNLQTLKLSGCRNLTKLPKDLGCLISLRYLDVRDSPIVEMPTQISKLKSLRNLSTFVVGENNGAKIEELGELSNLRGRLTVCNIKNVVEANDDARVVILGDKNLEELVLDWGEETIYSERERDILHNLWPNTTLKYLCIKNYGGATFPKWVGDQSFDNLVTLSLYKSKFCKTLPPLGQLPSLNSLWINHFDAIETVGVDFYGTSSKPFASLEALRISDMLNWKQWSMPIENVEAFPKLRTLRISTCQTLTGDLPCLLPSLIELSISDCPKLASSLPVMPVVTKVKLSTCQRLAGFQVAESFNFPQNMEISYSFDPTTFRCFYASLRNLNISRCNNFEFPAHQTYESLEHLEIVFSCDSTTSFRLDSFPNIRNLKIDGCKRLEFFTFSPNSDLRYPTLTRLQLWRCEKLKFLPEQLNTLLPSLEDLDICGCPELESFPRSGLPSSLHSLTVESCDKLIASRKNWNLQALPNLKSFKINGYKGEDMESFPEQGLLPTTLTGLELWFCKKLKFLPEQLNTLLPCLEELKIRHCSELESFPRSGLPSSLHSLKIGDCDKLIASRKNWNLQALPNLKRFEIWGYKGEGMESFPEQGLLPTTITDLSIGPIDCIISLDEKGFQQLTSLEKLSIQFCPKLQTLPKEGLPISLQSLRIVGYPLLKKKCEREKGEYWNMIARIPHIYIN